jgi:hypothetical protein
MEDLKESKDGAVAGACIDMGKFPLPLHIIKESKDINFDPLFDTPCPDDIHGMNEWVLNHLPVSDDDRNSILADLRKYQTAEERQAKVTTSSTLSLKKSKTKRHKTKAKKKKRGDVKRQ